MKNLKIHRGLRRTLSATVLLFITFGIFLNATNWLIGDVEAISVRPNTSRASRFQLTADQFATIRSASLFLLPEAIAVLGVFTWWSRRHPGDTRR